MTTLKNSKWLSENASTLEKKMVAVSGATGGIGRELCRYLLFLGASLILLDRNKEKSDSLKKELREEFSEASIDQIILDLEDIDSVKNACTVLEEKRPNALILNAGAYSIPRHKCSTGYDNVFQINFVSPYYMARRLAPILERIVAVGSIAHNYSRSDIHDVDFGTRKKASLVYGNAKRYLMYALEGYFANEKGRLALTHPGITLTGITDHYPRLVYAVIKNPMKVIFMKPRKACLCILRGLFESTDGDSWIGPRIFDIWGYPKKKKLKTAATEEKNRICAVAEKIYKEIGDQKNDRS